MDKQHRETEKETTKRIRKLENKERFEKSKREIMDLLKLKVKCRIRGLSVDIENGYGDFYKGAKREMEELLRHLESLDYIVADIDCALKYLTDKEKSEFCKILTNLNKIKGGLNSSQP